jgi:peptidoglycan/LPS O-acetylase OafA/YrhL
MMLAVLAQTGTQWYAFVCLPLALICYVIVSTPIGGEPTTSPAELWPALTKSAFYAVIATLLVAPLALGNRGWYSRVLGSRPMVWLGEISYEIFLIHLIVMEVAMVEVLGWHVYTGNMAGLFVVTFVMTVPLAWLLHRLTRVRSS